jgi:hypothetical protein
LKYISTILMVLTLLALGGCNGTSVLEVGVEPTPTVTSDDQPSRPDASDDAPVTPNTTDPATDDPADTDPTEEGSPSANATQPPADDITQPASTEGSNPQSAESASSTPADTSYETFTSEMYRVTLSVPAGYASSIGIGDAEIVSWDGGQLQIASKSGPESTWTACTDYANNPGQTIGTNPTIEDVQIPAGQPACVIGPADGDPTARHVALVAYPGTLLRNGVASNHVLLDVIGADIYPILESLRFLPLAPEPTLTHAAAPTPTPDLTSSTAQGKVNTVQVEPVQLADPAWRQLGPGDSYTIAWDVEQATEVRLCVNGLAASECIDDLPLQGTQSLTLRAADPVADHWVDVVVEARGTIHSDQQTLRLYPRCHYQWFQTGLSTWCPSAAAIDDEVLAQHFQNGWMISQRGSSLITVLVDTTMAGRVYNFLPERDLTALTLTPPDGLYRPHDTFAALWAGQYHGAEDVRELLGWATDSAFTYNYHSQCDKRPQGDANRCFERRPDGQALAWTDFAAASPDRNNEGIAISTGSYQIVGE